MTRPMFQSVTEIEARYARMTSRASVSLAPRPMNKSALRLRMAALGKTRRHGRPRREIWRQFDLVHVIQIEKFLRSGRRTVRFHKSARDEKRLVLVFAEILNRAGGGVIHAMRLAAAVKNDNAIRISGTARVGGQRRENIAGLAADIFAMNCLGFSNWRTAAVVSWAAAVAGLAPRFRIVNAAVINFSCAHSDVAVFLEQLRQRRPVRMRGAEIRAISENACLGRISSGEQRRA